MSRNSIMAQEFKSKIGFLNWVQLDPELVAKISYNNPKYKIFISPDVHSLHIAWEEPPDEDGNTLWHQIENYQDDISPIEFLENEMCMCAEGPIEWTNDIYEAISDFSECNSENVPIIKWGVFK